MSDDPAPNAKTAAVASILTSGTADTLVKLGTLALVGLSGFGNFAATKNAERITNEDAEKAVNQIHELYRQLEPIVERQKDIVDRQKEIKAILEKIDRQTNKGQQ